MTGEEEGTFGMNNMRDALDESRSRRKKGPDPENFRFDHSNSKREVRAGRAQVWKEEDATSDQFVLIWYLQKKKTPAGENTNRGSD